MIGFLKVIHVNVNHTGAIVREIVIQDRHSHYCPSSFFLNVKLFICSWWLGRIIPLAVDCTSTTSWPWMNFFPVQADVAVGELNTSKWEETIALSLEVEFFEGACSILTIHQASSIAVKVAHPSAVQANENVAEACTLYRHFVVTFSSQRGSHFYETDVKFLKWAWWFVLTVHCSTSGWHGFCYSGAIAPNIHIGECKRSQWFYLQGIHEFQKTVNHLRCESWSRVRTTAIAVNANHGPVAIMPRVHRAATLSTHRIIPVRYTVGRVPAYLSTCDPHGSSVLITWIPTVGYNAVLQFFICDDSRPTEAIVRGTKSGKKYEAIVVVWAAGFYKLGCCKQVFRINVSCWMSGNFTMILAAYAPST